MGIELLRHSKDIQRYLSECSQIVNWLETAVQRTLDLERNEIIEACLYEALNLRNPLVKTELAAFVALMNIKE